MDDLPTPIEAPSTLPPVTPPPGSPDFMRRQGGTPAPAKEEPKSAPLPFERLQFRSATKPISETVALDYPFDLDGKLVDQVTVRRLAAAEVADVVDGGDFDSFGVWSIYAAQTGFSVGILRGLDEDDCDRVVEAARRFLPRAFTETLNRLDAVATSSSAIPKTGAPTSPA